MFASYCQALLLSLSIILSINNTRDRVEGESGERKRRKVGGRTGCIGGTMFIKEYIYTFIHGQPAFTEVTLIVDRRHSSPPALWREEMRDAQNKKDRPTPGSAARRQRADGRRFVKQARDAHGEHTPSFFILTQTTTQQQAKTKALRKGGGRGLIQAVAMFWLWQASCDVAAPFLTCRFPRQSHLRTKLTTNLSSHSW